MGNTITQTFKNEWYKANDYELNEDYIIKLLNRFNLCNYNATINQYGKIDLSLTQGIKKYKIVLDYDKCIANIHRGKMTYVSQKSSREYMPIIKSYDEYSVWYDVLKFISKDI